MTVGPAYFQKVTGPLFFALVLLMGIAPLFAWRKQAAQSLGWAMHLPLVASLGITAVWGYLHRMHPASIFGLWLVSFVLLTILVEFWKGVHARMQGRGENLAVALRKLIGRNHRRYGGYVIHLGVVMIALGVIGDAYFKQETQGTLTAGESLSVGGYSFRFEGLRVYPGTDGREVFEANATLSKNGETVRSMQPRRDFFVVQEQPVTVPAVYATAGTDIYILLLDWQDNGRAATFRIYINSLINWVWTGGLTMILGTLIAAWPPRAGQKETTYQFQPRSIGLQPSTGD